jgi:opacity protein-like surface antigen
MKLLAVGVLTILAVAPLAVAQDHFKSEIFGGYSLEHISACGAAGDAFLPCASFVSDGHSSPANYNGWNASFTSFVHKFVGFTADFSGHYGTTVITGAETLSGSTSRYSYMFGPVAAFRKQDYSAFVHALFGGVSGNFGKFSNTFGGGFTAQGYTQFAWAIGGGVDVNTTHHMALRLAQFDYERVNVPGGYPAVSGFRYSGGVVFKF